MTNYSYILDGDDAVDLTQLLILDNQLEDGDKRHVTILMIFRRLWGQSAEMTL